MEYLVQKSGNIREIKNMDQIQENHIFLLKNSFRRRGLVHRITILNMLFLSIFMMSIFDLLSFNLQYLFHYSLLCYVISFSFLILVYKAHTGRFSLLKIENQALYLPKWINPEKYKVISLKNIYSIHLRLKNKHGFIMIGLKKGINKMLITSQFEVTEDIPKFVNIIRGAIAHYEKGNEKLDTREELGRSYEKIIAICSISISIILIIFYILQQVLVENSNLAFELLRLGGLNKYLFATGEYFRITSSLFLHLNLFHLSANIFTLMIFGNLIEHIIKKVNLMTIFFLSGLLSSLLSILSGQHVVTIGASGGIYGIIGAYLFIRIKYGDFLPSFIRLQQGWVLFIIFFTSMLYSLINPNIDFFCHLGGLITGFAYMAFVSHFQNHKINALGDKNKFTKSILFVLILLYMFNFLSLGNFILEHQDFENYKKRYVRTVLWENIVWPSDQAINFVSYAVAKKETASVDELIKAREKMELIVEKRPYNHQCKDTLALIYFRLGMLEKAIEMQKEAISLKNSKEYIIQLKRFENYKVNEFKKGKMEY